MKKLLLVILLLSAVAFAKDRAWQTGKLVTVKIETEKGDSSVTGTANQYGVVGHINSSDEINVYVTISADKYEYFAGRKLYSGKIPPLTENAPVKFALDKDILILVDDRGKEFKMRIGKRTAKD